MKIICDGADLSDAVLKVSKGTSNKTTNPILEGIKVVAEEDFVTLTATDLELSIEKTIKSAVQIEGEIVVPGKFFSEYIKKLNNEQIELSVDEKNVLSIKYTDSVKNEDCLKPIPKDKRKMDLYKIDEVYYKLTRVEQVEPNVASLTPYDGFVFDDGKRVYVFTTKYTPNRIKNRALQYAIHLRVQNAYQEVEIFMEPSPKMLLFYKLMKLDDKSYDEICEYINYLGRKFLIFKS